LICLAGSEASGLGFARRSLLFGWVRPPFDVIPILQAVSLPCYKATGLSGSNGLAPAAALSLHGQSVQHSGILCLFWPRTFVPVFPFDLTSHEQDFLPIRADAAKRFPATGISRFPGALFVCRFRRA
jgi:hypothetical protein